MQHEYFVYDGQEVIKTGRIASREQNVRGYKGTRLVTENVVEITPMVGPGEYAWKRWVREDELYIINDAGAGEPLPVLPVDVDLKSGDPGYDEVDKLLDSLRGKKNNGQA